MFMPQPPQATPVGETVDQGLFIPSGSKRRAFRKSMSFIPLTRSAMAASMWVAQESYLNTVPGSRSMSLARKMRTQSPSGFFFWGSDTLAPTFIVRRSRTRRARRLSDGLDGALSGKNESTRASRSSLPSSTRSPIAVEVKLLEWE